MQTKVDSAGSRGVGGEAAPEHYAAAAVPAPAVESILHVVKQVEEDIAVAVPMDSGQQYTEGESVAVAATSEAAVGPIHSD
mmetsp:Transcript_18923/g.28550  ORF Transcript_18923/g.28550 Transcript_18923/m.28550 type:complete len:81 (-) Transcript_18923:964-1206(-)